MHCNDPGGFQTVGLVFVPSGVSVVSLVVGSRAATSNACDLTDMSICVQVAVCVSLGGNGLQRRAFTVFCINPCDVA